MLKAFRDFLDQRLFPADDAQGKSADITVELAAAVLLLEISMADANIATDEIEKIKKILVETFPGTAKDIDALVDLATLEADHAVSLYEFTSLLNAQLSASEKTRIIERLWEVAMVDNTLDKYEEYSIRKIADLLYVPHKEFIRMKHQAAQKT